MKLALRISAILLITSNLFAQTEVSGTIAAQTWTPENSPYVVVGDILVASLAIRPGVTVIFNGDFIFEIAGILTAIGTEQDSISFTKADGTEGWQGIFFNHNRPGSELAYCIVENSKNGGIRIDTSEPIIKNSTIRNNSSTDSGAGIYANVNLSLVNCNIINNSISVNIGDSGTRVGGGIYVIGKLNLTDCYVSDNSIVTHGWFPTSKGGGIYIDGLATLTRCVINGNSVIANAGLKCILGNCRCGTGTSAGGGIYVNGTVSITLINCIISRNSANGFGQCTTNVRGDGVFIDSSNVTVTLINCTIAYNSGEGFHNNGGNATAKNSIFYFNNNNGAQISGNVEVTYSCIQGGFEGVGNITSNPVFGDTTCLQIVPGSPCIDAGDPDPSYNDSCFPPSLETARNDMGAYGGSYACGWIGKPCGITTKVDDITPQLPGDYFLAQNYPNPFNPSTSIQYSIPQPVHVSLSIFNMLGQKIAQLVNESQQAGTHNAIWNVRNSSGRIVSTGLYVYRLEAGNFVAWKKMIVTK